jgi:hypothetical protein
MSKLFIALSVATIAGATPALAETMTHNGVTYVYSVETSGNTKIIKGEDVTNRRAFTLRVNNGWVEGDIDGRSVSFSKRDVVRLKANQVAQEVAAR